MRNLTLFLLIVVVSISLLSVPTFQSHLFALVDTSSYHSDIPLTSVYALRHDSNGLILCNRCTINTGGTPGPVGTDDIEDGAVTNPKLTDSAVTEL